MPPVVTIAIPVYKRLDYVAQALRSVAAQDYPAIELIVSDNGQNGDRVAELAREHYGKPFVFRQNPASAPIVTHFNQLVDAASGTYFGLLSDDDELSPNWASELVGLLERNPNAGAALARVEAMDVNGVTTASSDDRPLPPATMSAREWIRSWATQRHSFISYTTNLSRLAELRAAGKYPEFDGANGSDNGLLIKQCIGREIVFSPRATFRHRIHDTSFGKSVSYKSLALASRQFLRFLDHDPQLRAYAKTDPEAWAEIREHLRRIIWITYLARWNNLYRKRMSYGEWVRGGFQLPFIPAYYRRVLSTLIYSVPALAALRGLDRPRPS